MRISMFLFFTASITLLSACLPPVYVFDKPTVFEKEASGEYPLIEKDILEKTEATGPMMMSPEKVNEYEKQHPSSNLRKDKIYRILNGEYVAFEGKKEK